MTRFAESEGALVSKDSADLVMAERKEDLIINLLQLQLYFILWKRIRNFVARMIKINLKFLIDVSFDHWNRLFFNWDSSEYLDQYIGQSMFLLFMIYCRRNSSLFQIWGFLLMPNLWQKYFIIFLEFTFWATWQIIFCLFKICLSLLKISFIIPLSYDSN